MLYLHGLAWLVGFLGSSLSFAPLITTQTYLLQAPFLTWGTRGVESSCAKSNKFGLLIPMSAVPGTIVDQMGYQGRLLSVTHHLFIRDGNVSPLLHPHSSAHQECEDGGFSAADRFILGVWLPITLLPTYPWAATELDCLISFSLVSSFFL
jgi:hypothetical protein